MDQERKRIQNSSLILKDVVQGDVDLLQREEIQLLNNKEIRDALRIIMGNPNLSDKEKLEFMSNSFTKSRDSKLQFIDWFVTPIQSYLDFVFSSTIIVSHCRDCEKLKESIHANNYLFRVFSQDKKRKTYGTLS